MNNNKYQRILLLFLTIAITSCATAPSREPKPVTAGFLYEGSYINVRAPDSEGWNLVSSSPAGMEFARSGAEQGESFGAQLLMFPLAQTNGKEEFVSVIKQSFENDFQAGRYEAIDSEFEYSEGRDYPCVEVAYVVKDTQAQTSPSRHEVLFLQAKSLYCRHPVRQDTGFSIIYSHRGKSLYSNLAEEAQGFIEGVQVPNH